MVSIPLRGSRLGKNKFKAISASLLVLGFNPLAGESFGKEVVLDSLENTAVSIPLRGSRLGKLNECGQRVGKQTFQSPCGGVVWERTM